MSLITTGFISRSKPAEQLRRTEAMCEQTSLPSAGTANIVSFRRRRTSSKLDLTNRRWRHLTGARLKGGFEKSETVNRAELRAEKRSGVARCGALARLRRATARTGPWTERCLRVENPRAVQLHAPRAGANAHQAALDVQSMNR